MVPTSISNPPINATNQQFIEKFVVVKESLENALGKDGDTLVKVVVVASILPTYFIDIFVIELLQHVCGDCVKDAS